MGPKQCELRWLPQNFKHMKEPIAEPELGQAATRPCQSGDFEGVLKLLAQLWPNRALDPIKLREVFERGLASDRQIYLCVCGHSQVLGFGSMTFKNNLWQQGCLALIDELVVDAQHRGKGIGTQLLQQLLFLAKQKGSRAVELDSAFHREAAHRFYEHQGFQKRAYLFSKTL